MSMYDWRIATDHETYLRQQEKRVMREERRPIISSASDLLGPGAAPHAVSTNDWNAQACTFNGVFWGQPGGQVNSPNDTLVWLGHTSGTRDGSGVQRLVQIDPTGANLGQARYEAERFFSSPGGALTWGSWRWTKTPWINCVLLNSWAPYDGVGVGRIPQYRISGGEVLGRGIVKSGVTNHIFTLPPGFRPDARTMWDVYCPTISADAPGAIVVDGATGGVHMGGGSTVWIALDPLRFAPALS